MTEVSWQPTAYRAEVAGHLVHVYHIPTLGWAWQVIQRDGCTVDYGDRPDIGQAMAAAKQAARRLAAESL